MVSPIKRGRILSFKYAASGIYTAIKQEPNLKIHLFIAVLVILAGIFFQISQREWLDVILLIGLVITIELTNTAIETVVNHFTDQIHPGAKLAKDISAGAALIAALTAAVVGLVIFLPHVNRFLNR